MFTSEVQFGHAGACANAERETADAKNQASHSEFRETMGAVGGFAPHVIPCEKLQPDYPKVPNMYSDPDTAPLEQKEVS